MLFTAAGVLLIRMTRWYFASAVKPHPSEPAADSDSSAAVGFAGIASGFASAVKSAFGSKVHDDASGQTPRSGLDASAQPTPGRPRSTTFRQGRRTSTRSRHARPPVDEDQPHGARDDRVTSSPVRGLRAANRPAAMTTGARPAPGGPRPKSQGLRSPRAASALFPRERYQPHEPPPRRRPAPGDSRYGADYPRAPHGGTAGRHPVSRVRYRGERDGEPRGGRGDRDSWR